MNLIRREIDGRSVWSICLGRNQAGLQLRTNLEALKLEPAFAERQQEINSQLERAKALREEADWLEVQARRKISALEDDLQVEVTVRHGWPHPVVTSLYHYVSQDLDRELAALQDDSAFDALCDAIDADDPRITGTGVAYGGDIRWMRYVSVSEDVQARI